MSINNDEELELDILENAIDSLNESIKYYEDGESDGKAYKFSILLLNHFAELFLKYCVSLESKLLLYKEPSKPANCNSHTISLSQAIMILKNLGKTSNKEFIDSMDQIQRERNQIQHSAFSYSTDSTKHLIGRVYHEICNFNNLHYKINITDKILPQYLQTIQMLENGYITALEQAKAKVEIAKNKFNIENHREKGILEFHVFQCDECGEETVVKNNQGDYECTYCGDMGLYIFKCGICGDLVEDNYQRWTGGGMCENCSYRLDPENL